MRPTEAVTFKIFAATTALFQLIGGKYICDFVLVGSQTAKLQRLGPDGSTFIDVMTALSATGASPLLFLVPGQYRFLATTSDAAAVSIARSPGE